uniref:NAC domain-containing protein 78 n=1 Tax=Cajanus cajan TaxID=3821 RepID=A0A151ST24_CAJCA|nr:NAC domain-containing protein 78 [Cajanus cajan]
MGKKMPMEVMAELDLYKYAPWDLPDMSLLKTGDLVWFFFCPKGKKYLSGERLNRATEIGYWKTTGKDREIEHNNRVVGMIKTLVFHTGKAPKGDRTDWVMHEFRIVDKELADKGVSLDSCVICKVFQKEGLGPRNGAQYGKPFNEKDWDTEKEIDPVQSAAVSAPVFIQPNASHISAQNNDVGSVSELMACSSSSAHPSAPNNEVGSVSELMTSCSAHPSAPNNEVGTVSELMTSCSAHPSTPNNEVGSVSEMMTSCSAHPSTPNIEVGSVSEMMTSCSAHPSTPNNEVGSVSEMMTSCSAHPSTPNIEVGSVSEMMTSCSAHPSTPNIEVGSVSDEVGYVSELMPSCSEHPLDPNNQVDDDVISLLDWFTEGDISAMNENNGIKKVDDPDQANDAECAPCSDPNEIFENLGDLDSFFGLGEGSLSSGQKNKYTTTSEVLSVGGDIFSSCDPVGYLELFDLEELQLLQNKHGSCSQDKEG